METQTENNSVRPKLKKELTNQERQAIAEILLMQSENGKLKRRTIPATAKMFSVCARTVSRIWHRLVENLSNGSAIDVSSKKQNRVGRKRAQVDLNKVSEIPLRQRTNIRSLSFAMQVPKSILHRRIKDGLIRRHSNALKPSLTEENKKARLLFCLSMLEQCSLHDRPTFCNMLNYVHIDEKWFYMSKESEKYYLLPEENEPVRTCKSKRFITKVMFLAAVARPRYDTFGHEVFSGKIGIFPFICKVPAKRSSKNRMVGTLETKPMSSITKDIIRSYLIERVLPAIRAKWPCGGMMETIYIQQDNAKPHIDPLDAEFLEAATKDGFDIRLTFQPPNSPDLNVLDLGYFRAIQSLQYQQAPTTVDELVDAVEKSFNELSAETLDNVFLTLQGCMIETMKVYGANNYKLPHMKKNQLRNHGNLPSQLYCERDVVENALSHLRN